MCSTVSAENEIIESIPFISAASNDSFRLFFIVTQLKCSEKKTTKISVTMPKQDETFRNNTNIGITMHKRTIMDESKQ